MLEREEMERKSKSEFEYIMTMRNLGRYVDKWIAVVDNHVVAKGMNAKEVFEAAKKKYPKQEPLIMKVPSNRVMLL